MEVDRISRRRIASQSDGLDVEDAYETSVTLRLGESAGDALLEESHRLQVSVEELATFAVLYYLADLDSGRIARSIPPPCLPA
jgi:hypothetical protein